MREILFRGKRVDNGEWVYGYYIKATHHWHNHGIHEDWIVTDTIQNGGWCNVRGKYAVIPETVEQYTGYDAINGKIFEGDVIKAKNTMNRKRTTYTVVYEGNTFYFLDKYRTAWHREWLETIEIIGNIHENPADILIER